MQEKAFLGGVVPGGLTTSKEIKILICYLLSAIKEPVSHSLLITALTKEGLVNYFECADALGDLMQAENIVLQDDYYSLSEAGRDIAENLYENIPLTVRERVVRLANESLKLQKNRAQHHTRTRKINNGYVVRCWLSDNESELFSLELYAPNRRYAQNVERNFVMNGEELIRTTIANLTADADD